MYVCISYSCLYFKKRAYVINHISLRHPPNSGSDTVFFPVFGSTFFTVTPVLEHLARRSALIFKYSRGIQGLSMLYINTICLCECVTVDERAIRTKSPLSAQCELKHVFEAHTQFPIPLKVSGRSVQTMPSNSAQERERGFPPISHEVLNTHLSSSN